MPECSEKTHKKWFVIATDVPRKDGEFKFLMWQYSTWGSDPMSNYFWTIKDVLVKRLQGCPRSNSEDHAYAFETEAEARALAESLQIPIKCYKIQPVFVPKEPAKVGWPLDEYTHQFPGESLYHWLIEKCHVSHFDIYPDDKQVLANQKKTIERLSRLLSIMLNKLESDEDCRSREDLIPILLNIGFTREDMIYLGFQFE